MSKFVRININMAKQYNLSYNRKFVEVYDRESNEHLGNIYFSTNLSAGQLAAKIAGSAKHSALIRDLSANEFKELVKTLSKTSKSKILGKKLKINIFAVVDKEEYRKASETGKYSKVSQPSGDSGRSLIDLDKKSNKSDIEPSGSTASATASASAGIYPSPTGIF